MSVQRQKTLDLEDEEEKKVEHEIKKQEIGEDWAKLTSLSQTKIEIFKLSDLNITIGRNATNTICIPDKRLSGLHCEIVKEETIIKLIDHSTNGTYVNNEKIGKDKFYNLQNGDMIHLLHHSKVKENETLGYFFTLNKIENLKRKNTDENDNELTKKQIEKMKKLDDDLGEGMKCVICIDLIYQCVTVIDCLHNFCGACFSDWMKKSKECPNCRNPIKAVKKNPIINSMITQYLDAHPEKQRSKDEYDEMDKRNKITCDVLELNKIGKKNKKLASAPRRARGGGARRQSIRNDDSDVSYESDSDNLVSNNSISIPLAPPRLLPLLMCKECVNNRTSDQFKCGPGQIHLYCSSCRQAFPDRPNANYKQKCQICNIPFCNLYLNCNSNRNPKLFLVKDHKFGEFLQPDVFRGNKIEYKILDDFMKSKNFKCKDIYEYVLKTYIDKKTFNYVVNKYYVPNPIINLEISIDESTAICTSCFSLVWFQMVFLFAKDHKNDLPKEIKDRGSCWYGINCKTMVHNEDHAKKLNHICLQTRFQ